MDWLGAGVGLVQGLMSQFGQEDTNAANAQMASNQMEFQERMSSTAYQRAVKDMEAAGLSPMLAYSQGGASTPGGAMATMQNALGAGVSSAQIGSKIAPEIENLRSVTAKNEADTKRSDAEADLARSQAAVNAATVPRIVAQTLTEGHSGQRVEQEVRRLMRENQLDYGGQNVNWLAGKSTLANAQAEVERQRLAGDFGKFDARRMREVARREAAEAVLAELDIPEARSRSSMWGSEWGKNLPYIESGASAAGSVVNSASQAFRMSRPGRTYYRGR